MALDFLENAHLPRWNRKLLYGYWAILALSILVTALYDAVILLFPGKHVIVPVLSMHTLWSCCCLLIIEVLHALIKPWRDYIVIIGAVTLSANLIVGLPTISPLLTTLYLPILVSVFYFQHRKVIFAFGLSLICFLHLYWARLSELDIYELSDLFAMPAVLLVGGVVALGIMERGAELLRYLRSTLESEQELLVKNIIMDKLAKTDALTELYNHMSFHEYLDKLIEQGEKHNLPFQLAVLDIDHFKKVNDTYGHRAGDAVLKQVATVIREMVSLNDFPARYGGEEFAVLFTDISLEAALEQCEQIRSKLSSMTYQVLGGNAVTISIGIHSYRQGCNKEDLFSGADEALYAAKRIGRNRTVVYSENMYLG
jgi:diguanylate cyclase